MLYISWKKLLRIDLISSFLTYLSPVYINIKTLKNLLFREFTQLTNEPITKTLVAKKYRVIKVYLYLRVSCILFH